jgi:hypothetical protein
MDFRRRPGPDQPDAQVIVMALITDGSSMLLMTRMAP